MILWLVSSSRFLVVQYFLPLCVVSNVPDLLSLLLSKMAVLVSKAVRKVQRGVHILGFLRFFCCICRNCVLHKLHPWSKVHRCGCLQTLPDGVLNLTEKSVLFFSRFQIRIGGKLLLPAEVGIDSGYYGAIHGAVLRSVQPLQVLPCFSVCDVIQIQPQGGRIDVFHAMPPVFLMRRSASSS
nr:MAG TPA: hypothetical protein [Caudoviricetes sp.]